MTIAVTTAINIMGRLASPSSHVGTMLRGGASPAALGSRRVRPWTQNFSPPFLCHTRGNFRPMWRYGRWEEQWTGLRTTRRPAFSRRGRAYAFNINGNAYSADGFDAEREWARGYWSVPAPFHSSVCVKEEGEDRVRQAYGAAKYDRLKALKRTARPC